MGPKAKEKLRLAKQGLKRCSKCKGVFEYIYFSKSKSCSDGHYNQCKGCSTSQESFEAVRLLSGGKKKCRGCGEAKLLGEFGKRSNTKTGVAHRCKACISRYPSHKKKYCPEKRKQQTAIETAQRRLWSDEYRREYNKKMQLKRKERYAKNPSKYKELRRKSRQRWAERNPLGNAIKSSNRRAQLKERGGDLRKELVAARFEYHGNKCVYCKCGGKLTIDHQIPLCRGGLNIASNIVPACRSCNSSKGRKTPSEFMRHKKI